MGDTKRAYYERKQDGHRVGPFTPTEMSKLAGFEEGDWDELPEAQPAEWEQPKEQAKPAPPPPAKPNPPVEKSDEGQGK